MVGGDVKVLLVTNYSRLQAQEGAHTVAQWLEAHGVEPVWAQDDLHFPEGVKDASGCDLVVSLGGDGTLLRAARMVGYEEVPILGLSYGHLGFLTGAGSDTALSAVERALEGELHISRRSTLSVTIEYNDPEHPLPEPPAIRSNIFCLNEVAVTRGALGNMVEFDVFVSGNHIDRLRADGFVVSTATGSTGYALSAGGPIVTPEFQGMVNVPVAPHTILARAFLTSPQDVVEVALSTERPVEREVFCDGRLMARPEGLSAMRVISRKGPGDIVLLDDSSQSFYRSVSRVFYGGHRS